MKHILTFILILLTTSSLMAQNTLSEAADAYTKGEFQQAVDLYEKALSEEGEAAQLHYNLGNAYYKTDQLAKAVLNYERALLLAPGFADAQFNLEIAQQRVVDKIEPLGSFFLSEWSKTVRERFSSDSWANIAVLFFLLFIGGLVLYFFTNKMWTKKLGFFGACIFLVICIIANNYASAQHNKYVTRDRAVIFAPTVSIKSTPDANGTDLFILHEGTTVRIKSKLGSWTEIELADGNIGWIEQNKMEVI